MIQVGYVDQRLSEPDVTRVEEMSATSCSHSQAGFGPEDDLPLISDCAVQSKIFGMYLPF